MELFVIALVISFIAAVAALPHVDDVHILADSDDTSEGAGYAHGCGTNKCGVRLWKARSVHCETMIDQIPSQDSNKGGGHRFMGVHKTGAKAGQQATLGADWKDKISSFKG